MEIGAGEEGIGVAMIWDDRLRSGWSGYTAPKKKAPLTVGRDKVLA
jgi:hypothetical protein